MIKQMLKPKTKAHLPLPMRLAAWQVLEIFSPRTFWRLKVHQLRRRSFEHELRIAPHLCNPHKISIDIGASVGFYSVNICENSARCIAFEPRPDQAARLLRMVSATGLRIQVEALALSDSAGFACLRVPTGDPGRSSIEGANHMEVGDGNTEISVTVTKRSLDEYGLLEVGFIKIDVEGHEMAVLRGAENTLRNSMPIILVEIEERHRAGATRQIPAYLAGLGYEGFFVLNHQVIPIAHFDSSIHQNVQRLAESTQGCESHEGYVNNFFFLPIGNCERLKRAVSLVASTEV
jgi:FkbM family methyltransferase